MRSQLDQLSDLYSNALFVFADADCMTDSSEVQALIGVPTTYIYKAGEKINEFSAVDDSQIRLILGDTNES